MAQICIQVIRNNKRDDFLPEPVRKKKRFAWIKRLWVFISDPDS